MFVIEVQVVVFGYIFLGGYVSVGVPPKSIPPLRAWEATSLKCAGCDVKQTQLSVSFTAPFQRMPANYTGVDVFITLDDFFIINNMEARSLFVRNIASFSPNRCRPFCYDTGAGINWRS